MPERSRKVYVRAAVGRRRQRRREVGHELRSGEATHLVERREAVAGHPQERKRVRVAGKGGIDGVDGAALLEPLRAQHERPAAMVGAQVTDGDEHGVARRRQSQWAASHAHSLRHLVPAGIDPHDVAVELVAHPDAACVERHRVWPVPGGDGRGDRVRVGIDPGDRPVQAVRHPRRAVAEGDPRRAVPDLDRRDLLPGRRVDANHPARGTLARPQRACAERELGGGDLERLGALAARRGRSS